VYIFGFKIGSFNENLLPTQVRTVKHHAALALPELPQFMAALRNEAGVGARALEFAILTAARTGEVLGTRWSEVDLDQIVQIENRRVQRYPS